MNKTEEEIYSNIIESITYNKRMNTAWLETIGGNKKCYNYIKLCDAGLIRSEYTYLDYLDGRKNLIDIPNFCKYTGEKISKKVLKENLEMYFK